MPRSSPRGLTPRLPSWTSPPDPNLYATSQGELRVPFALHVAASARRPSPASATTFPQFSYLPIELQHHVLSFCNSATLYQLTRVAHTRAEASKRFWGCDRALYCISGAWIRDGGYVGETFHDVDFLARVERVNVWFDDLLPLDWTIPPEDDEVEQERRRGYISDFLEHAIEYSMRSVEEKIRRFWETLLRLCPRLTHVLVTADPEDWDSRHGPNSFTERILRPCPAGVSAFVSPRYAGFASAPEVEPQWHPHVWRLTANTEDKIMPAERWAQQHVNWTPQFVLPPPKKFYGPVGAFQRSLFKFHRHTMWKAATRSLSIDAVERHHFHNRRTQFGCPLPDCRARFRVPGAYLEHCRQLRHDRYADPPEPVETLLKDRKQTLDRLREQLFWDPYSPDEGQGALAGGSSQYPAEEVLALKTNQAKTRHAALRADLSLLTQREDEVQCAFLYQLQHDPLYATREPAYTTYIWKMYEQRLREIRSGEGEFGFCATTGQIYPEIC
jgi:hypothetical protein